MGSSEAGLLVGMGLALAAGAIGCASGGGGPRACGSASDCGAQDRCASGACVENSAPEALLSAPGEAEALALVEVDGSGSTDRDVALGDALTFRWSFTSLDAPCDPPLATGTASLARVRFSCPGRFGARLVAVDDRGAESVPATAAITIREPSHPTAIAGPDRAVEHHCFGAGSVCGTEVDPALGVELAPGLEPCGALTYRWTFDPAPGAPAGSGSRVTFAPSAEAQNPTVHIETDGTAVVGDWVFHVVVSDPAGPLGQAASRVSVRNRPPSLAQAAPSVSVDHSFSADHYRASAATSHWSDPDGDPLTPARATGDSMCSTFSIRPDGTAVVECAWQRPANALGLSSFTGAHAVSLLVRDPWVEAPSASSTAISIGNRPVGATSTTLPAASGTCSNSTGCCVREPDQTCAEYGVSCKARPYQAQLAVYDPDGDPLSLVFDGGGSWSADTAICLPDACTASGTLPALSFCGSRSGSLTGTFSVTDGLTSASGISLTLPYAY